MLQEKFTIKNRHGLPLVVLVEQSDNPQGLAFVMHGLGGFKEQPHIERMAKAFLDSQYTTVRFDATNAQGESGGAYKDATITSYAADLEDVIAWAKNQPWYIEPFVLTGHGLGATSVILYTQRQPNEVKALASFSTVVSGALSLESHQYKNSWQAWKETGWLEKPNKKDPAHPLQLPWSHMEDRLKYNLTEEADKLTMPVLMVVGEADIGTPPEHQKILFDALPGPKELQIIPGAEHGFKLEAEQNQIYSLLIEWIKTI